MVVFTNTCTINSYKAASERRFLFTKWLGNAWEEFTTQRQYLITKTFKRCGMFNDILGPKNYLVKIERVKKYTLPTKDDPLEIVEKKKRKRKAAPALAKGNKKQKIQ